jgi:hypothetical protein
MKLVKNKKAQVGDFMITFIATVIIALILLLYALFSLFIGSISPVQYGVDSKTKEVDLRSYFYSYQKEKQVSTSQPILNFNSFQYLYYIYSYFYTAPSGLSENDKLDYIGNIRNGIIKINKKEGFDWHQGEVDNILSAPEMNCGVNSQTCIYQYIGGEE